MKSVCIVGAGPAGLVAAKTFLQTEKFDVVVYEKKERIGGIWALDQQAQHGFLSPYTPTNLSRFTVGFSDLDWNSVNLQCDKADGRENGVPSAIKSPMFPKAWMVNRYLETYRERYIPDDIIQCSLEVTRAERVGGLWRVSTVDVDAKTEQREFDYLIMASGFFARQRLIEQSVPGFKSATLQPSVKIMHSTSFRHIEDLVHKDKDVSNKYILMLGGGNSSGETAAAIALQLSNARWSPDTSVSKNYENCKIVHVTPRPLYPLPPFHEYENGSKSYVPLDFRLYDFSKRPRGQGSYAGPQTREIRDMIHGALQAMVGGDQSDISAALVSRKRDDRGTAYVALTESYAEYVRSGLIDIVSGRVVEMKSGKDGCAIAVVNNGDEIREIHNVAGIVHATGFTPCPALEILDSETKIAIKYDFTSLRLPVILEQWQTMSPEAPAVSFLGFYEGPYWPIMEMQARLTAKRWLSEEIASTRSYESEEALLKMRHGMQERALDIPQFWFNDYFGYMEDMADDLALKRNHRSFKEREGCTSPARYLSKTTNSEQANAIMDELRQIWQDCILHGKYVPRAVFRALHGNWNISRRIESKLSSFPSGTLEGTASFHPRFPTSDQFDLEYLYIESGTFTLPNGLSMTAKKRYVYRYSEADDTLSVWFVKLDNNLEVDYLFHDLEFVSPEEARKAGASVAKADHLCVDDMYWTSYWLPMKGVALSEFEVKHAVQGPSKDYVATTKYVRPKIRG